jgi:hypothetical protein
MVVGFAVVLIDQRWAGLEQVLAVESLQSAKSPPSKAD